MSDITKRKLEHKSEKQKSSIKIKNIFTIDGNKSLNSIIIILK